MTVYTLILETVLKDELWSHLLPTDSRCEQAAFLFCKTSVVGDHSEFAVLDTAFLTTTDFAAQYSDYLELSDATRIALIKRAHALGASLVELHSHPGLMPAKFSFSDRRGLRDTVPHMWWRLKRRPYLAIVVAPSGYDALLWRCDSRIPEPLGGIQVSDMLIRPTNASLEGWHDEAA